MTLIDACHGLADHNRKFYYESIYKKNVRDNTSVLIIALNRGVIEQPKE